MSTATCMATTPESGLAEQIAALPGGAEAAAQVGKLEAQLRETDTRLKRQSITYSTIIEIANRVNASGLDLRRIESYTASMVRGQFGVLRVFLLRGEAGDEESVRVTIPNRSALDELQFPVDGPFGGGYGGRLRRRRLGGVLPAALQAPQ